MTKNIQMRVFIIVIVALLSTSIQGQEVEDESKFDYKKDSVCGPEKWGSINHEWAICNSGKLQSPIDLVNQKAQVAPSAEKIEFSYFPSEAVMKNRGHDIELKWDKGASKIRINNTDYVLTQLHWHSPSEHTVHGKAYDMELHLVHKNSDPKAERQIAVIGLLYQQGEPDKFLDKIQEHVKTVSKSPEEIKIGEINPADITEGKVGSYHRYTGSLTTPPCTEGVLWTVDTKIGTVAPEQLKLLREGVHDKADQNARPVQPSNGRSICQFESHK